MKEKRVRIFLLHRRVLAVLCTLAVAAGIFYVTLYPASRTAAAAQRQLPIYSVERVTLRLITGCPRITAL